MSDPLASLIHDASGTDPLTAPRSIDGETARAAYVFIAISCMGCVQCTVASSLGIHQSTVSRLYRNACLAIHLQARVGRVDGGYLTALIPNVWGAYSAVVLGSP